MLSVHCEKKGENKYTLEIDRGGKDDVASIVDESLGADVCIVFFMVYLPGGISLETQSWFFVCKA